MDCEVYMKKGRIYICHTFFHVYVSFLKEFAKPEEERGNASVILSTLSNDFADLSDRILTGGVFKEVFVYDEKRETDYPELAKWKKNRGNILFNLIPRIVFTKKFAKAMAPGVPVDFREYDDVYLFCDSDPIGYYLNKYRIPYHSVEDGLDCYRGFVPAIYDNRKFLKFKLFLSRKLNWIYIGDGYGKYCIDMEVNDLSIIGYKGSNYIECPRKRMEDSLTEEQKNILVRVFVRDMDRMLQEIRNTSTGKDNILILTEPLCTLDVRQTIFRDLIARYEKEGKVFLKIHPRDELDYEHLFSDVFRFDKTVPMEILNFFSELHFKKVVSVFTELGSITFADEKERLGRYFMDRYEDPEVHNQNEKVAHLKN